MPRYSPISTPNSTACHARFHGANSGALISARLAGAPSRAAAVGKRDTLRYPGWRCRRRFKERAPQGRIDETINGKGMRALSPTR